MLAAVPSGLQVGLDVVGGLAGLAALLGVIAGAVFVVRRSKITGEDQLAQSAVTSLTGELAAHKSENERQASEIRHLHELLDQQKEITTQLEEKTHEQGDRIAELTRLITGSEKIDALTVRLEHRFDAVYEALNIPIRNGGHS